MGDTIACIAIAVFFAAFYLGLPLQIAQWMGEIQRGEWDSAGGRAVKAQAEAADQWRCDELARISAEPRKPLRFNRIDARNCANCGAPHEPVCSYCGTRGA